MNLYRQEQVANSVVQSVPNCIIDIAMIIGNYVAVGEDADYFWHIIELLEERLQNMSYHIYIIHYYHASITAHMIANSAERTEQHLTEELDFIQDLLVRESHQLYNLAFRRHMFFEINAVQMQLDAEERSLNELLDDSDLEEFR